MKNLVKRYYLHRGFVKLRLSRNLSSKFHVASYFELEKILDVDGEATILSAFLQRIRPTDIIFDVGANMGLYTVPSALKAEEGQVIAFEPVPLWLNRLRENLSLNRIRNVQTYNLGLSREARQVKLTMKSVVGSGMGSIMDGYADGVPEEYRENIDVALVSGDGFISENEIPSPNLVKIDVEGAELDVLAGLRNAIAQQSCRAILCEVHPLYINGSPADVENLLRESGYRLEVIGERRSEYYVWASRD